MQVKLYFDENVPEAIAAAVRLRGYDVTTVKDADRKALSDLEQLRYASLQKRVLFTFNVSDFIKLHEEFMARVVTTAASFFPNNCPSGSS